MPIRQNRSTRRNVVATATGAVVLGLGAAGAPLAVELGRSEAPPNGETVMLLHGLGRTEWSMALLAERIEARGYDVVNVGYPSRDATLEELVARLDGELAACCAGATRDIHFVTHSLGGIVVRAWLDGRPEHRGRIVMLAPPSRGSEMADALADEPLMDDLLGPTGSRLGTGPDDIPRRLGPVTAEVGVLAADRSIDPLGSWLIPGDDDGKVAVERARVDGAADFRVLPATHAFIMNRRDVADEVLRFLATGAFSQGHR